MKYNITLALFILLSIMLLLGCDSIYVLPKLDSAEVRSEIATLLSGCFHNTPEYISSAIGDGTIYTYGDKTISFSTKAEWKEHHNTVIPHKLSFLKVQIDEQQIEGATILTGDYEGFTTAKVSFTIQYNDVNGKLLSPEKSWEEEILFHVIKRDYFGQSYADITKIQPTYEDFLGLFIVEAN